MSEAGRVDGRIRDRANGTRAKVRLSTGFRKHVSSKLQFGAPAIAIHAHRVDGTVLTLYQRDHLNLQLRAASRAQRDQVVTILLELARACRGSADFVELADLAVPVRRVKG